MDGPRPVRREEAEDLANLLCEVFQFHEYYDRRRLTRDLLRRVHLRGARVIAEDGRPVSHILFVPSKVSIHGCRVKVVSIGGVSTDPRYRQRGYAGTILQQGIADATAAGARVMLVSGDRSLYRRNHCVPAGHLLEAVIRRGELRSDRRGLRLRRVAQGDWPELAPIYAAEPVRFLRSLSFFSECCWWWDCGLPEIWVIACDGRTEAYLSLLPPWRQEAPVRTVGEYAGSRAAVLDALPAIFDAMPIEEIRFQFPGRDHELPYLLSGRAIPLRRTILSGALRLLNLPGLMRDLRPYLAARLPRKVLRGLAFGQRGELCRFSLADQHLDMSLSQAAALVLGGPDAPEVGGALGEALGAVLPIPLPLPGFNYV